MEKNVNEGSATIELAIILPGIIIIVCLLILIWLKTFEYDVGMLQNHYQALSGETPEPVHIENHWYLPFKMIYDYAPVKLNMTKLQRTVEYILYLVSEYYERIGVHE